MITDIRIQLAILMYLVGCVSLIIYNVIVVYRKSRSTKAMSNSTNKWIRSIYQEFNAKENTETLSQKSEKHLLKKLKRVEQLLAFSSALCYFKDEDVLGFYDEYMDMLMKSEVFHTLANAYREKKKEERAYFAYFISQYPQLAKDTEGICTDTINAMVSYIDDSDIYCRANVLKALCSVGDLHGIINVLQSFNDSFNFIHYKLLAEELFNFAGDKDVLALYLWGKCKLWNENITLGVITFITMFSDEFKSVFLPVLKNKLVGVELRIAFIKYYKEYRFKPAQPILAEYLNQTENYALAAEAASALSSYSGHNTISALTLALQSNNWHVQYSAASSLVALGKYPEHFAKSDSDTLQIVQYMREHINDEKYMNVSDVII